MNYQTIVGPAIWLVPLAITLVFTLQGMKQRRAFNKPLPVIEDGELPLVGPASGDRSFRIALYALAFMLLVSPALAFVPAGHRGVVYGLSGGVSPDERPEGLSIVIPWLQHVTPVNVRTQVYTYDKFYAQSSDLQEIVVPIAVNVHIDPKRAAEIYQEVGMNYGDTVIKPAIDQHAKAAIGQVTAEDFPQNRDELAVSIVEAVAGQLAEYGIIVDYANVADAVFDKEFMQSVRDKVIAEQNVAEAKRRVEQARFEAQQAIEKAEGERAAAILAGQGVAEANRLIQESLTIDILTYIRLNQWDGRLPSTLLGDGEPLDVIVQLPDENPPTMPEEEPDSDPYSMGSEEDGQG